MKAFLVLFIAVFTIFNHPNDVVVNEIELEDHQKVESTFSGNISGDNSFHLIIAKNSDSKDYDVIPYLYQNDEIVKLKPFSFEKQPAILSFHNHGTQLSLVAQSKTGKSEIVNIIDVDLVSGEHIKSDAIDMDDFKTLIRKKDKNLIVFADKDAMKILEVKSSQEIKSISVHPDDTSSEFFKSLSKSGLDAINNDEFVANGSISTFRAYSDGKDIIITEENTKEATTNSIQIPLDKGDDITVSSKSFSSNSGDSKIKKSTSYVNDGKLYQFKLGKEVAKLNVFGINDDSKTSLDILSTKPSHTGNAFKDTKDFVKNAAKNVNEPTVTINNTKDGQLKVRFVFVNKNVYNYRYDWWWHHQWHMQQMQMFMHQQQQMRQSIPSFGPSEGYEYFFVIEENAFFEITLDSSGHVHEGVSTESLYRDLDKKSYIKPLDDNKKLKHTSTVFTDSKFRYITYNKREKSFKIIDKAL
ncbi:hypothetical protein [Winogradskyella psychrotolerans]|uniref:hypothetical protein n=1 Tax=Winogradskyella psychrotolerans TaxID=1344585 RepID=UPI001C07005A|nr:hypothetical protein [Winogradskyella psychrotolerans]MBU2926760.1 hypothetical protein [Winogradskyella psychrotolerans]